MPTASAIVTDDDAASAALSVTTDGTEDGTSPTAIVYTGDAQ